MKVVVLSDIPGNGSAFESVVEDIKKIHIQKVIVLGDIVCKGNAPQACFDLIMTLDIIAWVKGNTDDCFNQIDKSFKQKNDLKERICKEYLYTKKLKKEAIEVNESYDVAKVIIWSIPNIYKK